MALNSKIINVRFENGGMFEEDKLILVCEDGALEEMKYFGDEISFTSDELIGLTVQEAHDLKAKKDLAYLQS